MFPVRPYRTRLSRSCEREPDWTALPADVPSAVRTLIRRCLAKDRRQRIADISVAQFVLEDPRECAADDSDDRATPIVVAPHGDTFQHVAHRRRDGRRRLSGSPTRAVPLPRVSRFLITPPSATALTVSGSFRDLALTPDGTRLVYVGANGASLFVRTLDQLDATPLAGLNAAFGPFVSPDGQWIGVYDGASAPALKKVAITGGPAVTLGRPDGPTRGASWGADGTIIFATISATTGLQRIAAAGGEPTVLTRPNRAAGEADHVWPEFLPGGQAVLFTITANDWPSRPGSGRRPRSPHRHADRADSGRQRRALRVERPSDLRGGGDAAGRRLRPRPGSPSSVPSVAVLPEVWTTATGAANVTVAADGTLVYVPRGAATVAQRRLVWVDRQGQETPLPAPPRSYVYPRLSPNGSASRCSSATRSWTSGSSDLSRSTLTRVTSEAGLENYPVWAPDGRQLFFSSDRAGRRNLFAQAADWHRRDHAVDRECRTRSSRHPSRPMARGSCSRRSRQRLRRGTCCSSDWIEGIR